MKRIFYLIPILLLTILPNKTQCTEWNISLSIMDRYTEKIYNNSSSVRIRSETTIYQKISDFEISLSLNNYLRPYIQQNRILVPELLKLNLGCSYYIGDLYIDLYNLLTEYTNTRDEIKLGIGYFLNPIEVISIIPEANLYYDFNGFYWEICITPQIIIPLDIPIQISIPTTVNGFTENYMEINQSVIGGFILSLKISLFLKENFDLILHGGYFISTNPITTSYPFLIVKISKNFE
ncbi:MAG: hypothetical protein ACK4F9_00290 [Brevinematia bacterium]